MNKIFIIGLSGSGKTTLAKKISNSLKIPHYDLDDIYWKVKYSKERPEKEKKTLATHLSSNKTWVIEGSFTSFVSDIVKNSDVVIWLDLPTSVLMYRIFIRWLKRNKNEKEPFLKMLNLVNFMRKSKNNGGFYHKQKAFLEKHNVDFTSIQNNQELEIYLETLD